jgi:hypothetical protein
MSKEFILSSWVCNPAIFFQKPLPIRLEQGNPQGLKFLFVESCTVPQSQKLKSQRNGVILSEVSVTYAGDAPWNLFVDANCPN